MLWHEWWVWAVAGLVLGMLELLVPSYIFLGFAIGALVIALATALGVLGASLAWMIAIFAVVSLGAFLALRKMFPHSSGQVKVWTKDIND